MIELKNVYKSFNGRTVLENISVTFMPGETNLIIGASGSGKSVLMKCMVGLERVDSGNIIYDGRDFTALEDDDMRQVRREIGMLFQGAALFDSLSVEKNVAFPLEMFTNMSPAQIRDRVNECLKRVNLENANKKFPSEISGGMKKRVGIARAIALNPRYLFCDEPNSGLDPITSRVIDELICDITREYNITTIINTHDMKTVFEMGENVVFIYKGRPNWVGNKDNIKSTSTPELQEFIRASYFMD